MAVGAGDLHAVKIREERNFLSDLFQRFERWAKRKVVSQFLRVPCLLRHTVWRVKERHALGRLGGLRAARLHGLKKRQRHRRAATSQEGTPRNSRLFQYVHLFSV